MLYYNKSNNRAVDVQKKVQEIKYCFNDTIYTVLLVLHHSYRAISFEAESANIQDDPVLAVHVFFFFCI